MILDEQFPNQLSENIPRCYTSNTVKEELILEHVTEFARDFPIIYEDHIDRQLFLFPENECGLQKFICTTVRPTKLGFLELYNYDSCAEFISKFMIYEELDPPDQFPTVIPSPSNALEWQKGDCFDFSIVLCSLLIGVGYDAYCVFGNAPREITSKNEALLECPCLNELAVEE